MSGPARLKFRLGGCAMRSAAPSGISMQGLRPCVFGLAKLSDACPGARCALLLWIAKYGDDDERTDLDLV